jgi:hypothetical protein
MRGAGFGVERASRCADGGGVGTESSQARQAEYELRDVVEPALARALLLIDRARHVECLELWEFVHRFMGPAREVQRLRLLEVLIERVSVRSEAETFRMGATLLWGNNERWKSEAYGQALILAALRRGNATELSGLLNVYDVDSARGWVRHRLRYRSLEDLEEGSRPQVKVMHYAFACGLVTWASELLVDGDSSGVERALAALCLLDRRATSPARSPRSSRTSGSVSTRNISPSTAVGSPNRRVGRTRRSTA